MQRKQQIPTSEALGFSQGSWSLGASWVFDFRIYAFADKWLSYPSLDDS